jgi:hypothetical protein
MQTERAKTESPLNGAGGPLKWDGLIDVVQLLVEQLH